MVENIERKQESEYVIGHIDEAVDQGWIQVFYQPIVRTISNEVCGMEALARWNDPERGLMPPATFINSLEDARLIYKLDLCVIRQVVSGIAERCRNHEPEIPISINLSKADFPCCDMFKEIETLVQKYDIPRRLLDIEVTESILTSNESGVLDTLDKFREAGYELWMDDFGSGYSTLNLLKDYNFDLLKLDMVFMRSGSKRALDIVASVISMDKKIGIRTLAEGVETKEQSVFLINSGCEKMQGYYFGKPQPFNDTIKSCVKKGLGIESTKHRVLYDKLGKVDFQSSPLTIAEVKNGTSHIIYVNDRAMKLIKDDGFSDLIELEKNVNDKNNLASQELMSEMTYVLTSGQSGDVLARFNGHQRMMKIKAIGSFEGTSIFIIRAVELKSFHEKYPEKFEFMQNLSYFYRNFFSIDLKDMTIRNLRLYGESGSSAENNGVLPITGSGEGDKLLLQLIFIDDRKRFKKFLNPATLKDRLKNAPNGFLVDEFRTIYMNGRYVWMTHKILLAPNSDGKHAFYVVRPADERSGIPHQEREKPVTSQEVQRKANLFDEIMRHDPRPIFWKDKERRFLGANQSFLDYYGYSDVNEIIGKTDEDLQWHTNNDTYRDAEEDVLTNGVIEDNVKGRCISNGVARDIFATKWPTYDGTQISGLMGYFIDKAYFQKLLRDDAVDSGSSDSRRIETVSEFLEDLTEFDSDYQLNKRKFGVISIQISDISLISENYGKSTMYAAVSACIKAITKVIGNSASFTYIGLGRFVIMSSYASTAEFDAKEQKIRDSINTIHQVADHPVSFYAKTKIFYTDDVLKLLKLRDNLVARLFDFDNDSWISGENTEELEKTNRLIQSLIDEAPIACFIMRPDHTIVYWNRETEKLLGFSASDMLGKKCFESAFGCHYTNGCQISYSNCPAVVSFTTGRPDSINMFMNKKDGGSLLVRNSVIPLKDRSGKVLELINVFSPLAEETYSRELVQSIYETATRDAITGLPGRKYMEECLEGAFTVFERTGNLFAVLFADIDNFHDINNTYGHNTGDSILNDLGLSLRKYSRRNEKFCRWGGDEFVGLLELKKKEDIKKAAARFHELANSSKVAVNGADIMCQTAIGITCVREGDDISSILSRADSYMYKAKRLKKNQIITDFNADD
ncbi:MAG: EAL domain-containing protein [Lachnospiraceae bacterium]|uniref:EAL domain-containing protein n=1 Tax=Candidatus Weimeria bifida TaxID=2599074 RepID=A0A6N7IWG2_9FIRM|nr:EAL domain-containing protein [Candidatus Weimeria bifida]RRF96140.1 MAG: EAL domain-containing protein [Lachnospiraceae bacterium]